MAYFEDTLNTFESLLKINVKIWGEKSKVNQLPDFSLENTSEVKVPQYPTATPRTITHLAPLSLEFSRQEYWSG